MKNKNFPRGSEDRLVFVAEVILDGRRPAQYIDLVLSIAGRESTFTRRWVLSNGLLDAPAAADLGGCLSGSVIDAITMLAGVQEVLPLSQ